MCVCLREGGREREREGEGEGERERERESIYVRMYAGIILKSYSKL